MDIIIEKLFLSNLVVVIASRGQPDVGLPRSEVESEKSVLREQECLSL